MLRGPFRSRFDTIDLEPYSAEEVAQILAPQFTEPLTVGQPFLLALADMSRRNPRDALAPNAQYWIGDAWFNLRDFRAASSAQQSLITTYPDSPKVPDAMLNLSSSQIALGDSAAAKKTLEELVNRFPQTDAAEKGRQRLARMR